MEAPFQNLAVNPIIYPDTSESVLMHIEPPHSSCLRRESPSANPTAAAILL
jgi:hypothetical protein